MNLIELIKVNDVSIDGYQGTYYDENLEYVNVTIDADGKMLEGIKSDGSKHIVGDLIVDGSIYTDSLDVDRIVEDIEERVDEVLKPVEDTLECFYTIDNIEWLQLTTDNDGRIIEGINFNGHKIFGNIPSLICDYVNKKIEEIPTPTVNNKINTLFNSVERNNIGSRFDFTKVGVYDYYAAFDELAYTYKNDFKIKENIGESTTSTGSRAEKDSNTYPIKRYTFKKAGTTSNKTIVLCGAVHGDSNNADNGVVYNNPDDGWYNDGGDSPLNILCQYFFLKDFLENHDNDEMYTYLYDNFIIEVVPIMNPWGVQNHSRANGNDVDLARNFDYNWTPGTSYGHSTGTAAFSENESAAFRDFITSLSNVLLCIECHARGGIFLPASAQFLTVCLLSDTDLQEKVGSIIRTYIISRFAGSYSPQLSTHAGCSNWVKGVLDIPSFEPEFGLTFNENLYTRNTKMVNYQMTVMLKELITRLV